MPFYPTIQETPTTQLVTDVFAGYNHNLKINDGEFFDMKNLTSDYFPMLANRGRRGEAAELSYPGGIIAKEYLAYVDNGRLYYNGQQVPGITLTTQGEKQLVSMGAYLVIFPDKKYVNTKDFNDQGEIDAQFSTSSRVEFTICDADATQIFPETSRTPPANPRNGDYWLDQIHVPHSLKQYNEASATWVTVPTVYCKIAAQGIGADFKKMDGVTISGINYQGSSEEASAQYAALNGTHIIWECGTNFIVIVGLVEQNYVQTGEAVTVERKAPSLDYVTEAGNRLWGCFYGDVDGKPINEIYCCKLGDFKNWQSYQGISTDSYTASVGTDGKWTGAVTHLGYPIFFKENVMHKVYVSSSGAHQINDIACRGVQDGCSRSLAIVGERLYYKSRSGIMMYDGSLPELVSAQLGNVKYRDAAAGAIDNKYYVSMHGDAGWNLFVLDAEKNLWHREDETHASGFARLGNELFYIDADKKTIVAVNGSVGATEDEVAWSATTGIIGYTTVEQKYITRFNLRMMLPVESEADMYIEYDSSGIWEHCGHMKGAGTKTFMLPVRPRRCDHFQFRIEGKGDVRVYSFAKIFEQGSDGQ